MMASDDYSIDPYVYPNGTPYVIYWTSLKDAAALQDWLEHLRKKTWWTETMEKEFIEKVKAEQGRRRSLPF